jgi:hypothetical protein
MLPYKVRGILLSLTFFYVEEIVFFVFRKLKTFIKQVSEKRYAATVLQMLFMLKLWSR